MASIADKSKLADSSEMDGELESTVEQEEEDFDIDSLVNKTLQKFSSSKFHSKAKACSALHRRLVSSGGLGKRKLQAVKGAIEEQHWKTGEWYRKTAFDALFVLLSTTAEKEFDEDMSYCLINRHAKSNDYYLWQL